MQILKLLMHLGFQPFCFFFKLFYELRKIGESDTNCMYSFEKSLDTDLNFFKDRWPKSIWRKYGG